MSRRWRGVGQRRGEFLTVPPPASAWAPPFGLQAGLRGRWAPAVHRGAVHEPPWPHNSPRNRAEGSNGVSVTVANSLGPGSEPWDSISATAPVYDTSQVVTGSSSIHVSLAAQSTSRVRWSTLFGSRRTYYGRAYVRVPSAPTQIARIFQQDSQAGASQWGVAFDTAGKLIVRDLAGGATVFTSTATPATATWHRVEWRAVWDGANTIVTVRLFLGVNLHGLTPDEEGASSSFAQAAEPFTYDFGLRTTTAATWDVHLDDLGLDAVDWIGPSGTPPGGGPVAQVTQAGLRSRWAPRLRRGRFSGVPSAFAIGPAGGVGEGNRRALAIRRGQFHEPPWPQVAAQPSVWRPSIVRAVLRLAGRPIRRGAFHEPPWPQAAPAVPAWVPPPTRRRRPQIGPSRHGEFFWTPPRPAGVPAWLRTRPRPVPSLARRGQFHEPRWVEGPQTAWRPDPVCQAGNRPKWPTHRPRRGRFIEPRWPQGELLQVNVNPAGPDMVGAVTSETDALAGATTQPAVLQGTIS